MGGRGTLSKTLQSRPWKLSATAKNQSRFGVKLVRSPGADNSKWKDASGNLTDDLTDEQRQEYLNNSLNTINEMNNEIFGVNTSYGAIPQVALTWGKSDSRNFGWASPIFDEFGLYDARITITQAALLSSPDTAAHEYLHALTYKWIKNTYDTVEDRNVAYQTQELQSAICRNALIRVGALKKGQDMDKNLWKQYALTAQRFPGDKYGAKNYSETLTVSMQMVLRMGNKASPYAKAIVAELRREARRQHSRAIAATRRQRKLESAYWNNTK